jgi:glycerol-3-phosphate cytidylyltransferase-like family protein
MGVPWALTADMIKSLNISVVCQGSNPKSVGDDDPYALPKANGIYQEVSSESGLNTEIIVERILSNRRLYVDRNKRMEASQENYYSTRTVMEEL